MSENNNSQSTSENNKPQPPKTIGRPPKTEFTNSKQQPKTPKLSNIN